MSAYDGQTDEQLLDLATELTFAAACEEPGSVERAMKWAAQESVANELRRRLARRLNRELGLPDVDI